MPGMSLHVFVTELTLAWDWQGRTELYMSLVRLRHQLKYAMPCNQRPCNRIPIRPANFCTDRTQCGMSNATAERAACQATAYLSSTRCARGWCRGAEGAT